MNKDPVKYDSKVTADLPQIRVPVEGIKSAADLASEQIDIDKLSKYVKQVFGELANAAGLSVKEVLHVVENIHVELVKDVPEDNIAIKKAIQEAIKKISLAVNLDTEQITHVFSEKKNTNLDDIISRLHVTSQNKRGSFVGY